MVIVNQTLSVCVNGTKSLSPVGASSPTTASEIISVVEAATTSFQRCHRRGHQHASNWIVHQEQPYRNWLLTNCNSSQEQTDRTDNSNTALATVAVTATTSVLVNSRRNRASSNSGSCSSKENNNSSSRIQDSSSRKSAGDSINIITAATADTANIEVKDTCATAISDLTLNCFTSDCTAAIATTTACESSTTICSNSNNKSAFDMNRESRHVHVVGLPEQCSHERIYSYFSS
uniref:RRM domain-containing protein n=1 Tax=Syphacia muris TaxID=451379 RepID=A0A0N5ACL3_9BILA